MGGNKRRALFNKAEHKNQQNQKPKRSHQEQNQSSNWRLMQSTNKSKVQINKQHTTCETWGETGGNLEQNITRWTDKDKRED